MLPSTDFPPSTYAAELPPTRSLDRLPSEAPNFSSFSIMDCCMGTTQVYHLRRKTTREVAPNYWRKLIEAGVPIEDAKFLAWTIARYDVAGRLPGRVQRCLIERHCRFICRAGLWRAGLLLDRRSSML